MTGRRIWILGSGGREHALAWRIARDPEAPEVTVAPGNDGIRARYATVPSTPAAIGSTIDG